jgi:hypothetical protein
MPNKMENHYIGELETLFCFVRQNSKSWFAIFLKKQRINPWLHTCTMTYPALLTTLSFYFYLNFLCSFCILSEGNSHFTNSNKELSSWNTPKPNQAFCFKGNSSILFSITFEDTLCFIVAWLRIINGFVTKADTRNSTWHHLVKLKNSPSRIRIICSWLF